MRKAWTLTKIYINSIYGIKGYINELKSGKKAVLKVLGVIALILVVIASLAPMLVGFNLLLYKALKQINQQGVLITNAVIYASIFTIVFGFIGVIATYFVDKERDIVLSLPIKPWYLLFAKFTVNYISEILITALIMLPAVIIYGINERPGIIYYIASVVTILFVPLIPLSLCYLILIPVMKFANFLKKKDTIMILSGVFGLGLGIAIQIFSQSMVKLDQNPQAMLQKLTSENGLMSVFGRTYYPSVFASKGILYTPSLNGVVNMLAFIAISLLAVILIIYAMSGYYLNSNIGSEEIKKSTKKYSEGELKQELRKKSSLSSLLLREIRQMNREPVYFLNGPLIILIMPLIIGITLYLQKDQFAEIFSRISSTQGITYYITLAVAGIGMFLGVTGTSTSSAISREGKAFMHLKSMPVSPKDYMNAKLIHGMIIGIIASLFICVLGVVLVNLPIANALIAFVISNLLMLPIFIAGLLIELRWPKLEWDNPVKAMKQNVNVVIVVLGEMFVLLPLLGVLVLFVLKSPLYGYGALLIIPAGISALLYNILIKYGNKRFYEIEM